MYLYCLWSPQSATRRSSKWRFYTAVVRPLSTKRSLDPDDPASYRPISNLCFVSKIVEKVMDARLCAHAHSHRLLPVCESACPYHSTETAVISILNDMIGAVDQGRVGALLFY